MRNFCNRAENFHQKYWKFYFKAGFFRRKKELWRFDFPLLSIKFQKIIQNLSILEPVYGAKIVLNKDQRGDFLGCFQFTSQKYSKSNRCLQTQTSQIEVHGIVSSHEFFQMDPVSSEIF